MNTELETKLQEKVARVERLEHKFSDSIVLLQTLDIRLNGLEKSIQSAEGELEFATKLSKEIAACQKVHSDQAQTMGATALVLSAKVDRHQVLHDKHQEKYQAINNLQLSLETALTRLAALEKRQGECATKLFVNDASSVTNKAIEDIRSDLAAIQSKILTQQDFVNKISDSQKAMGVTCESERLASAQQVQTCNALHKANDDLETKLSQKITALHKEVYKIVDDNIHAALPTIDINQIVSQVRGLIKLEITNIAADATNASLKYNNIDAQVRLMEKKLETLALMIKKLELAKQE